ncbi:nitroreductase family protein [Spirochaetia bacterium 38H-sp]|uniref:Nitroreductase family protein n=1 Tax=Rarispira pelagica TaxID=3141764 RepID=A0ABU9UAG6_9SPIR
MKSKEILSEIEQRRAYRALAEKPIEQDVLDRLLSAAVLAPSCMNKQPWRFLLVTEDAEREKVADSLTRGNYWAKKAPAYVLVITSLELDCKLPRNREYALFDTGMAVMNLLLQATKEGLYAHPMAGFDADKLAESMGIFDEFILVTVIALGWPGSTESLGEQHLTMESAPRDRKPIESVVFKNKWDNDKAKKVQ